MTPEQIRIAVAEACGWQDVRFIGHPEDPERACVGKPMKRPGAILVPNYPADLNACAEMEKSLNRTERSQFRFNLGEMFLRDEDGDTTGWEGRFGRAIHATALQRCEAFLRVKGLWRETS